MVDVVLIKSCAHSACVSFRRPSPQDADLRRYWCAAHPDAAIPVWSSKAVTVLSFLMRACYCRYQPRSHTIVEAHPDVYQHMLDLGWDKKDNVTVIFGRWQDAVKDLKAYDGIFFDTYAGMIHAPID